MNKNLLSNHNPWFLEATKIVPPAKLLSLKKKLGKIYTLSFEIGDDNSFEAIIRSLHSALDFEFPQTETIIPNNPSFLEAD